MYLYVDEQELENQETNPQFVATQPLLKLLGHLAGQTAVQPNLRNHHLISWPHPSVIHSIFTQSLLAEHSPTQIPDLLNQAALHFFNEATTGIPDSEKQRLLTEWSIHQIVSNIEKALQYRQHVESSHTIGTHIWETAHPNLKHFATDETLQNTLEQPTLFKTRKLPNSTRGAVLFEAYIRSERGNITNSDQPFAPPINTAHKAAAKAILAPIIKTPKLLNLEEAYTFFQNTHIPSSSQPLDAISASQFNQLSNEIDTSITPPIHTTNNIKLPWYEAWRFIPTQNPTIRNQALHLLNQHNVLKPLSHLFYLHTYFRHLTALTRRYFLHALFKNNLHYYRKEFAISHIYGTNGFISNLFANTHPHLRLIAKTTITWENYTATLPSAH